MYVRNKVSVLRIVSVKHSSLEKVSGTRRTLRDQTQTLEYSNTTQTQRQRDGDDEDDPILARHSDCLCGCIVVGVYDKARLLHHQHGYQNELVHWTVAKDCQQEGIRQNRRWFDENKGLDTRTGRKGLQRILG